MKNPGRFAGLMYLFIIISGIFAEMFVRTGLVEPGNAEETARNIIEAETLFRFGFISDIVMVMSYFALGIACYQLFKRVNKKVALVLLTLNLIGVPIMVLNMMNQFGALLVLNGADYLQVFTIEQLQALSLLFMNLHGYGYELAAVSYGTWLFPFGYLVFKSKFAPKIIGVFLMIASVAIMGTFVATFAFPQYVEIVSMIEGIPSILGEFSICLWLLIKGVKRETLMIGENKDINKSIAG